MCLLRQSTLDNTIRQWPLASPLITHNVESVPSKVVTNHFSIEEDPFEPEVLKTFTLRILIRSDVVIDTVYVHKVEACYSKGPLFHCAAILGVSVRVRDSPDRVKDR